MARVPFFVYSNDGTGLPLAVRLKAEGHPVLFYVKEPYARAVGTGLVPKTTRPIPPAGAIVIFDSTGAHRAGAAFRRAGHPTIGGNPFEQTLEIDRSAGARLIKLAGAKVPETHPFRDYATAKRWLKDNPGQWFVKVSADVECASTYDAPDAESMIRYLSWIEEKGGKVDPFELQRRIEGAEVSLNGWFDGAHFVRPFDVTVEEKRLLTGDLGPRTGCESNVVWHSQADDLAETTLLPLEARLKAEKYVGPLDMNMKLHEGEPYGLEWTARLGWDATVSWMRLVEPLGEQLEAFARGGLPVWEVRPGFLMSLRISTPPYPTFAEPEVRKTQGLPLSDALLSDPGWDPYDIMLRNGRPVSAGTGGSVGVVSEHCENAEEIGEARSRLVAHARHLAIPNAMFRVDPVSRWERDFPVIRRALGERSAPLRTVSAPREAPDES